MFTGLVESCATLVERRNSALVVESAVAIAAPETGESIAVNGCCLTLEKADGRRLSFHTLAETLKRTNLSQLEIGETLHLERALRVGDRLGGHLVQGHVDTTAKVRKIVEMPDGDWEMEIELPATLAPEIILKGSIAVDGVSLTVCRLDKSCFAVRLIPETRKRTALVSRVGKCVNLESDVIGKYVHHLLRPEEGNASSRPITMERLAEAGLL